MPEASYIRNMEKIEREGPTGAPMSARETLVLTAVVEDFIAHGGPVASQSIARQQNREGMSAATVRGVMADLSEAGYLEQPHTSAGRVPTARAFRYYVDQLLQRADSAGRALPQPAQERIEDTFAGVSNSTDFFARTPHILALLSGAVGVALTTPGGAEMLEHIHFARLGRARVLTVLVTTAGMVRDRLLTLERGWTSGELETAANYLNRNFHRWPLERIRQEIARRIEIERGEYDRILGSLEDLWTRGAMNMEPEPESIAGTGRKEESGGVSANSSTTKPMPIRSLSEKSIFVEGVANLMGSEVDREHLRRILMALEEKQRVIDLLNAYIDSHDTSVRVVVGLEDAMPEMRDLVLVAAPARRGQEHLGTVAVIGPTRMQYASTIGTVTYIADLFGRWARS